MLFPALRLEFCTGTYFSFSASPGHPSLCQEFARVTFFLQSSLSGFPLGAASPSSLSSFRLLSYFSRLGNRLTSSEKGKKGEGEKILNLSAQYAWPYALVYREGKSLWPCLQSTYGRSSILRVIACHGSDSLRGRYKGSECGCLIVRSYE